MDDKDHGRPGTGGVGSDDSALGVGRWVEIDLAGDLAQRRRRACAAVIEQAGEAAGRGWAAEDPTSWSPTLGMCRYGPGCVALALAGHADRAGLANLRALCMKLPRLAANELVVDLSQLTECEPALAHVLGHLRAERLSAGARVDLHSPPPELIAELGEHSSESWATW